MGLVTNATTTAVSTDSGNATTSGSTTVHVRLQCVGTR